MVISKNEIIKSFGTPSAYSENRLFHEFSDRGKEDVYYLMVLYGLSDLDMSDVTLSVSQRKILNKTVRYQQGRMKNILNFIASRRPQGLWLDMGCGFGQFMYQIVQNEGNHAVGTDIKLGVLKKASFLLRQLDCNKKYNFINQSDRQLPFKNNSFDYVLSADVLEHVGYENQENVLSEIFRVLKNGGQAIVHTPNQNRVRITTLLKKSYYLFRGIHPRDITHAFPREHISLTTSKRLNTICRSVGFISSTYHQMSCGQIVMPNIISLLFGHIVSRSFILVLTKK